MATEQGVPLDVAAQTGRPVQGKCGNDGSSPRRNPSDETLNRRQVVDSFLRHSESGTSVPQIGCAYAEEEIP